MRKEDAPEEEDEWSEEADEDVTPEEQLEDYDGAYSDDGEDESSKGDTPADLDLLDADEDGPPTTGEKGTEK